MEPVTVVAALGSISHLTNIAKSLGGFLKETGKVEAMEKLMDLNSAILEMQQKHAELFQENQALKEENRELKRVKDIRGELKFTHGVYFRTKDNETEAYCSVCLDRDGKLIRIRGFHSNQFGDGWDCRACKNTFYRP